MGHLAVVDATPLYLRSPEAASRIHAAVPNNKIVAILRQPAERAYSSYLYLTEKAVEKAPTFPEALGLEADRIAQGYFSGLYHKQNGFYHRQLTAYYALFSREQIKIFLYEDWNAAPQKMLHELFQFLEVDPNFQPALRRSNVTRLPRNQRFHDLAAHPEVLERKLARLAGKGLGQTISKCIKRVDEKWNLSMPSPLAEEDRRLLTADYREDILKLQDLIGRDLSHWLR